MTSRFERAPQAGSWRASARRHIEAIHATLPEDATFEQRVKALKEGYPFAQRMGWAYKAWLREQRIYLTKHQPSTVDTARFPQGGLEQRWNAGRLEQMWAQPMTGRNKR